MQDTAEHTSKFGRELYAEMARRGIRSVARLHAMLEASGYSVSRRTVGAYLNGETEPGMAFLRKVSEVLELTEDRERNLLWILYKWG